MSARSARRQGAAGGCCASSPRQQPASGRRRQLAPVSASQANAHAGAQRTPLQPAAAARTPPSAAVDSPDEPRASLAPAPAPRQQGPALQLSRQQKQHQQKQLGAHYAALAQGKAEADQTAAEMLEMIYETTAPKEGKTRFGAADVRWHLIKELLRSIGEGTEERPGDPAMLEQMLRHLLKGGIGGSKAPRFTEITAGTSGNNLVQVSVRAESTAPGG